MNVVSFKTAKFLQSIGYNEGSAMGYLCDGTLKEPYFGETYRNSDTTNDVCFEAPELLDVVKWLEREKRLRFKIDALTGVIAVANDTSASSTCIKNVSFKEMIQKLFDLYESHFELFEKEFTPFDE